MIKYISLNIMPNNTIWSKQLKQDDLNRWLAFGLIALAVLISYFPVLFYPPRADQVVYLAETANKHPLDLIFGCYDLNRHRVFAPGDEMLFRPLLYGILGSEQALFGHHFCVWQLLGLGAHLLLIWVLLRLLWRLSNPWLAFAGTWLFALSVVNYELVSWTHLSSYILMIACIVTVIEQVVFCIEDNEVSWNHIQRILIYFLIACFIYETANIFVLLISGMLMICFPKARIRLLLLFTPVILYLLSSYFNYTYLNHNQVVAKAAANGVSIGHYMHAISYLTFWWFYEGLFNGMYQYALNIRTVFKPEDVMVFKPLASNNLQVVLEMIILSAFGGLAWLGRRQILGRSKILVILIGMLLSYVAVIVMGRYHAMGGGLLDAVRINTYYSYMFWVIMVMIIFVFIPVKEMKTKPQQWLIIIFVTACVLSGLWQGKKIYQMAAGYSRATNSYVLLVMTLDLLIQEKKSEPHFSFYVDRDYPGNYSYYGSLRKETDPPDRQYTFAELLYPQYFYPKELAEYKFLARK